MVISIICLLGEMVANQFDIFDENFSLCDWYTFPIEIQRMLVIAMTNIQQPVTIRGYANTECTRDALKRVIFIINIHKYL